MLVGMPGHANSRGAVALLWGTGASRPPQVNTTGQYLAANGAWIVGEATFDLLGYAVAGLGDVDKDGFDDIIVGAWSADGAAANSGRVRPPLPDRR